MKFTRIDATTVNCIITADDMDEQGLSLEDFIGQTESAMEFIHELVHKAVDEVGYKPSEGVMPMQVAVLPDKSVSVTLSENPKTAVADMLKGLADRLQTFLEDVQKRSGAEGDDLIDVTIETDPETELVPHEAKGSHIDARIDDSGIHSSRRGPLLSVYGKYKKIVFSFDTINELSQFAGGTKAMTHTVKESALYRDCKSGVFYLYLVPGETTKQLSALYNRAVECGTFVSGNERFILHLFEGSECLIEKNALRILGDMSSRGLK